MAKRGQGEGTIAKRDDGTWWARITLGKDENGKQKRKAFYGKTRKEVQEKLTAALNDINRDVYIEPSNITVSQWLDTWLKEYKKPSLRPTTYRHYNEQARWHINPILGHYRLKDLRNDIIQRFVNELNNKGVSTGTIERAHLVLYGALKQAVKNELLPKNVADGVKLPIHVKQEMRVLSPDEQKRLIEIAKNTHTGEIFIMALGTGMRIGEILALTWDDINIDSEEPFVRVNKTLSYIKDPDNPNDKWHNVIGPTKTLKSNRIIPLMPSIVEMLKRIQEQQHEEKSKTVTVLKNIRISKGYTQIGFADKIGLNKGAYQSYENGERRPDMQTTQRIAYALNTNISEILIPEGDPNKFASVSDRSVPRYTLRTEKVRYEDNNLVFCTKTGGLIRAGDMRRRFRDLARATNIDGIHIHCLRHTFATRGLENGIELKVMQELLGHSSIKMTGDIYTHVMPDKKRASIMKIADTIKL